MRENTSLPITSTVRVWPQRMKASAAASAKMKPEQAALTSKPKPCSMPRAACTRSAVAGKHWSGVEVPTITASISAASIPASASAARPASAPMKAAVSCALAMWRWPMPVRSRIQLSEVSSRRARSSLLTTRSGR